VGLGADHPARENDDLAIRAELHDVHVMTDVFQFNFPAFKQCDAFEIFLGPANDNAYYEFHVTPSNSVLQLRFESEGEARSHQIVAEPLFSSETTVRPEGGTVSARIPQSKLFPTAHAGWLLSFGRYVTLTARPPVSRLLHLRRMSHRKQLCDDH
jgi:hypothetical protein